MVASDSSVVVFLSLRKSKHTKWWRPGRSWASVIRELGMMCLVELRQEVKIHPAEDGEASKKTKSRYLRSLQRTTDLTQDFVGFVFYWFFWVMALGKHAINTQQVRRGAKNAIYTEKRKRQKQNTSKRLHIFCGPQSSSTFGLEHTVITLAVSLSSSLADRCAVLNSIRSGSRQGWFSPLSVTADALATLLLLLLFLLCAGGNLSRGRGRNILLLGLATTLLLGLFNNGFGVGGLALALVRAVDGGEGSLLDGAGGGEGRGRGWGSGLLGAATLGSRLGSLDWGRSGLLLFLFRGAFVVRVVGLSGSSGLGRLLIVISIGAASSGSTTVGLELCELLVVEVTRGDVGILVFLVLTSVIVLVRAVLDKHTCLTSSGRAFHLLVPSDEISPLFWSGPSSAWIFSRFSPSHRR